MKITISKYQPLRGGSYFVQPEYWYNNKACINVKNKDDNCLRWTLRFARFPCCKNSDGPSSYPLEGGFNFDGIESPTPINQISRVEKQNKMAINVFGYENKELKVYRFSNQPLRMARINILLMHKEEGIRSHYVWITYFNRLLYQTKHQHRQHFCERCLHGYSRKALLERHIPECRGIIDRAV